MAGKYKPPHTQTTPHGGIVWCPVEGCAWHQTDSWATRERLGKHVVGKHYDDVVFAEGDMPEDLKEREQKKLHNPASKVSHVADASDWDHFTEV
jgi:hypothetical protein